MEEWVLDQFLRSLEELRPEKPWYWDTFLEALDNYHHMVYASAYTYRASVWFDFVRARARRARLAARRSTRARGTSSSPSGSGSPSAGATADPGNDFAVHGTAIVTLLRPLPARAVRRHAAQEQRATSSSTAGSKLHLLLRALPLDLRARARALRGPQGRRQARARGRGARRT